MRMPISVTRASFAVALLAAACPLFPARARAITRDVPAVYATIQDALDAAQPGDTIKVAPGEYLESPVIREDSITVAGAGSSLTSLRGYSGVTLEVEPGVRGVRVEGIAIRPAPGIVTTVRAGTGSAAEFGEVTIAGGTIGLDSEGAATLVHDSAIHDCVIAISSGSGDLGTFEANEVADNQLGVSVSGDSSPRFHHNAFERNGTANLQVSSCRHSATLDFTGNWWGTADETALLRTIHRDGSCQAVTVNYVPWCEDPGCLAVPTEPLTWGGLRVIFH